MTDCPICFETLDFGGNNCMRTECGHEFHTSCVMMNIRHSNNFKCPYCRKAMAELAVAPERRIIEQVERDAAPRINQAELEYRRLNGAPGVPQEGEMAEILLNGVWIRGTVMISDEDRIVLRQEQRPNRHVAPNPVVHRSLCKRCGCKMKCGGASRRGQPGLVENCRSTNKKALAYDRKHPRPINA